MDSDSESMSFSFELRLRLSIAKKHMRCRKKMVDLFPTGTSTVYIVLGCGADSLQLAGGMSILDGVKVKVAE